MRDYAYDVEKKIKKQTENVKALEGTMKELSKENKELEKTVCETT